MDMPASDHVRASGWYVRGDPTACDEDMATREPSALPDMGADPGGSSHVGDIALTLGRTI